SPAGRDSASASPSRNTSSRATAGRSRRHPSPAPAPRSPSCSPEETSMKILIADDDATLRNELAGLLREEGHEVVGASGGGEARRARILLGGTAAEDAIAWVLSDAATRGVLLAVVGPRAQPPSGATLVLRIDEESRPPDVFAANQLFQLNAAIEAHIGRVAHPVVYAADLSLLQAVHGLEDMKAWVRHMNGRCAARGGALVLASLDSELAEQVEKDGLP